MNRGKIFGTVFIILACALVWLGLETSNVLLRVLIFWPALSSGALGLAYVLSRVALLGKTTKGDLPVSRYWLFWPYHLVSYLSLFIARLMRVAPFQEIVPGLFLGGRLLAWEEKRSKPLTKASVLDLTSEFCEVRFLRKDHPYLCIPLLDGTAPKQSQLEAGVRFITDQLQKGPVYVHCAMGHGRGATFAIAWLVACGKFPNLEKALQFVQSKRPGVKIRPGQLNALRNFAYARRNL
jgi:hypothetical protein